MTPIGYEAADPPHTPSFEELYADGKYRLSDWLPSFEDEAEWIIYSLVSGKVRDAEKLAEQMVSKAAKLWEDR